jgi:KaiC/GvpD/RAD55 family RecA-like ATPase
MKNYNRLKGGFVILVEHPADSYFDELSHGLNSMLKRGYEAVYINSQRPYGNLIQRLKELNVNTKKLVFVDFVNSIEESEHCKEPRCTRIIPSVGLEHLALAVRQSLLKLKSKKRLVFVDSITTLMLYENISNKVLYRFYEFLMDTARKEQDTLILNVSQGMAKKSIIKDLMFFVDMEIK